MLMTHLRNNVVAYLALVVALGGTSYAAVTLPKDSVTAKQIKSGAVRGAEVKDGSLGSADFARGQLPTGLAGPAGTPGSTGPAGPVGPTWARDFGQVPEAVQPADLEVLATFTTPSAGRLHVYHDGGLLLDGTCLTAEGGAPKLGLYLDGVPIQGTFLYGKSIEVSPYTVRGVSGPVAAGEHVLAAAGLCAGEEYQALDVIEFGHTGAILIGS